MYLYANAQTSMCHHWPKCVRVNTRVLVLSDICFRNIDRDQFARKMSMYACKHACSALSNVFVTGKSTMIKLLTGELTADSGEVISPVHMIFFPD